MGPATPATPNPLAGAVVQTLDRWLHDEFDWSAAKRKRPARNARHAQLRKQTYVKTQKLYQSLE